MNLETFFDKFELFADAPDAVAKMRELVLELAIGGKLVSHSKAESAIPYASDNDGEPINIASVPENWRVVLLSHVVKNRSGNSKLIKGKLHKEPASGRYQGFSASGADVWCDDYEHEGEAIIISAVGARCGKAFKASGKWCAIANTNIVRPEPQCLDFDFAYLILNNEHFWVRGGSAQPFVKFPPSLDRCFALPPLAEQKRIVAKVDELMALCYRLEAQQQERETRHAALARASLARFAEAPTPANLEFLFHNAYAIPPADLRKSILTLAVQGKLVPQDSGDEPAKDLLARLKPRSENRRSRRGRTAESGGLETFDAPQAWVQTTLDAVADVNWGNTSLTKASYTENGVTAFSASGPDGFIGHAEFEGPGIVLSAIGARCGKCFLADGKWTAIKNTITIIPHEPIRPDWLYLVVNIESAWKKRGGAQPFIALKDALSLVVYLPPLAEQRRIAAKVDELMALVDKLEAELASARTTASNLLAAAVAELTQGKPFHASIQN